VLEACDLIDSARLQAAINHCSAAVRVATDGLRVTALVLRAEVRMSLRKHEVR